MTPETQTHIKILLTVNYCVTYRQFKLPSSLTKTTYFKIQLYVFRKSIFLSIFERTEVLIDEYTTTDFSIELTLPVKSSVQNNAKRSWHYH